MSADKCMVRYFTGKNNILFKRKNRTGMWKKYRQDTLRSGQEYSFNEITEIFLIVSCKIYSCSTNPYNGIINHMSDDPLC